jgi:hypothetical protein
MIRQNIESFEDRYDEKDWEETRERLRPYCGSTIDGVEGDELYEYQYLLEEFVEQRGRYPCQPIEFLKFVAEDAAEQVKFLERTLGNDPALAKQQST